MFKSNSFSTKRAYDAPLCEALEFQINEGILDVSEKTQANWSDPSTPNAAGGTDYYNYGGSF